MKEYRFDIDPVAKPRMTRRDIWLDPPRPPVSRYRQYKKDLNNLCLENRYRIGETLKIEFYLPMPQSWSKKKQWDMQGRPHQQKPDTSNLVKAFEDALTDDDSAIWSISAQKFWGDKGEIVVFESE